MEKASATNPTMKVNWKIVSSVFLIMTLLVIWMWIVPRGPFVVVVARPFTTAQSTWSLIADADGSFVSSGIAPWVAVAYSNAPSFPARLRSAGALFVFSANSISTCQQEASDERPR
ncbi:hypothetical protein [Agrobacterium vitis]|uniref:hypothetical protein n=1 Tax=Agrobacterium vitis TaxID=373 RepID=UPI0015728D7C|nr:hypothetical protein [Agrobacterium vitis]NSY15383.1 hypothetical protein [Agrobacterium vitis]NSY25140.1 hypothetical protein [Agrobacterium vitis]NTA24672.1 hypothetical protein [Agrobacterium vitis]WEO75085.1 hypothetical protein G6L01_024120 [Agrobacterium vitis]